MRKYKLTVMMKNGGGKVTLSGEFDEEEWERLEDYAQYADELLKTSLVQSGIPASLHLHWDKKHGMAISTELPPWDDVIVFLHRFRPVGLESESTYFYKVCNILAKELAHPHLRTMIQEQRDIFGGKESRAQFQIRSDDVVLNSEKILYDWLNAYEYHRNKEKREFIDSLHTMLPLEGSKVLFLTLLTHKAQAIHNIAALVRVVLGKQRVLNPR